MVYTIDSKPIGESRGGSSPLLGTHNETIRIAGRFLIYEADVAR